MARTTRTTGAGAVEDVAEAEAETVIVTATDRAAR